MLATNTSPGAPELQPERDPAACWLFGGTAVVQGLGKLPLTPLPSLGPHCCSLGLLGAPVVLDSHQPWAFGGFNPRVLSGVSPFSYVQDFCHWQAARSSMSVTVPFPFSQLPTEHSSGHRHSSKMDPACLPAAFPQPSSGDWGWPVSLAQAWWSGALFLQRAY